MGDLNARGFDGARQEGPWRRAPKRRPSPNSAARVCARAMSATLDSAGLTVASGIVAWCGATPEGAFTNFRPDGAHAELDFILERQGVQRRLLDDHDKPCSGSPFVLSRTATLPCKYLETTS